MAASESSTWRSLPLPPPLPPAVPLLLVAADIGPSSYTIHVSDMVNIWSESLNRKAICMRGWQENTSIDPSDTPENMARFLSCLKAALDRRAPGHDTTSLDLCPAASSDAGADGITLWATCKLSGLEPLKWPFHLTKQPPSATAAYLVLPLIEAQFTRVQEVQSLIRLLGHKDAILTKFSDKLETMGVGLEHVFTALSGRKKVTQATAEEKVKGLAPFDERKWRNELACDETVPITVDRLVHGVFGNEGLESRSVMEFEKSPRLDHWWRVLQPTRRGPVHESSTALGLKKKAEPPASTQASGDDDDDDDDDFQVQSTPPRPRATCHRNAVLNKPPAVDASTEDEVSSAIPDKNQLPALSARGRQSETTTGLSRLGTIGGKTDSVVPRSPSSSSMKADGAQQSVVDDETASEVSDDDATLSIPNSSPPQSTKHTAAILAPSEGAPGNIGGRSTSPDVPEKIQSPSSGPTPARGNISRKLGLIGGQTLTSNTDKEASERGRAFDRETDPPTRETSQERADRKRGELRRELERKAAAGPVKKKRRF